MKIIDMSDWGTFTLADLFDIKKGSRLTSADRIPGDIPYVGATMFNNGIAEYIGNDERIHEGEVLTVCYNGPVGTTFYQPEPFWATDDVNVLYPKFPMTKEIGLFLAPVIRAAGAKYVYIDKWKLVDMKQTNLLLPVTPDSAPDWSLISTMMRDRLVAANQALDVLERVRDHL